MKEHPLQPPLGGQVPERIALAAAKEAVRETMSETFSLFGINIANYQEMQEFREDLAFVRRLRVGSHKAGARFFMALTTAFAGAAAIGAWELIKTWARYFTHMH